LSAQHALEGVCFRRPSHSQVSKMLHAPAPESPKVCEAVHFQVSQALTTPSRNLKFVTSRFGPSHSRLNEH